MESVRVILAWAIVFVGFQFEGCSSPGSNVFTTSYQNTIGYFNTYYNAKRTFSDAVDETEKAQPATREFRLFTPYAVPQTANTKFLSVIEKCSKLIQFYPNSSLVDDAILMIGKSYLYLNEILPARRKFVELLENFPRSDLVLEAKFCLARTYYAGQNNEETFNVLRTLTEEAIAEKEEDIAVNSLLLEGQLRFDRSDYTGATESYRRATGVNGDDRLRSFAQFQLARCYQIKGDPAEAGKAFMKVLDLDPDFSIEYRSRLEAAKMFCATGDFDRALTLLNDLGEEKLTSEDRSYVDLETGNVYQARGDYEKARMKYDLVDSLYRRTDAAAKGYFQSGLISEKRLHNLKAAKVSYDKAKAEFAQSEITGAATRRSDIIGRYIFHSSELAKYDSLLQMALHPPVPAPPPPPDSSGTDSTRRGLVVPDSMNARTHLTGKDSTRSLPPVIVSLDTINFKRASNQFALGVLFFVDLEQPDSAVHLLSSLLEEYPESRFAPRALYALAEVYRSKQEYTAADSVLNILQHKFPGSEYTAAVTKQANPKSFSASSDSAESLYASAEQILETGNIPLAVEHFKEIAGHYRGTAFGTKARYATGWIYENLLVNRDSATVHYRLLIGEGPQSVYADRVRPKLAAKDGKVMADSVRSLPPKALPPQGKAENTKEPAKQIPGKKVLPEKPPEGARQQDAGIDSTGKKSETEPR